MPKTKVPKVTSIKVYRPWQRPDCKQVVTDATASWRQSRGQSDVCGARAYYMVDGEAMCRKHASKYVLDRLIDA